jgi:hypothetical protein
MQKNQSRVVSDLSLVLGDLFREFGFWRTSLAFLRAAWQRHQLARTNNVDVLSSRMRRDIGLDRGLNYDAVREEERYWERWR